MCVRERESEWCVVVVCVCEERESLCVGCVCVREIVCVRESVWWCVV